MSGCGLRPPRAGTGRPAPADRPAHQRRLGPVRHPHAAHVGPPRAAARSRGFDRLPTAAQVRTWPAESSWALTRCEVLIHELAEGLEYQRRWPAAGAASNDTNPAAWRVHLVLHRAAHAFGIEQEHRVALAQATRVDSAGTPYMRVGSCSEPEARQLHLVLGPHTETLTFGADDELAIAYHPHENRCTLAGLPYARTCRWRPSSRGLITACS